MDNRQQWAVVTGASSGIGAAIARVLAARQCNLVISARRADRLEALASDLRAQHGVEVACVPHDLSDPAAPAKLYTDAINAAGALDIFVNNAGAGDYDHFENTAWNRHAQLLQLNVAALAQLSHLFVRDARKRDTPAYLLNVSSIAAYQPVPFFAHYAATKAYILVLSESMAAELKRTNVSVTCVCPGGTATEFHDVANQPLGKLAKASFISAERVAQASVRAMFKRRRTVVTGLVNKFNCVLLRLVPRRTAGFAAMKVLGQPRPTQATPTTASEEPDAQQ